MLRAATVPARLAPPRTPHTSRRAARIPGARAARPAGVEALESRTLLSSGDLDPSFGVGGTVTTDVPGSAGNRVARQVALQSDGRIVQVAWHGGFGATEVTLAVTRFNPDGSVDTGFGDNGLRVVDYPGRGEVLPSIVVGPQDEIIVATWTVDPVTDPLAVDSDVMVAVLNADGTFDTTFGQGGFAGFDFGRAAGGPAAAKTMDLVFDVAVQDDGKIITAGTNEGRFALARLNTNGTLDPTFGGDGLVTAPFGSYAATANAVDVDDAGRIVVVGTAETLGGSPPRVQERDWAVARYNPDGSLDTSFDSDGWTITSFGTGFDTPFDIVAVPGGKIVASGSTVNATTATDMAVARYNADGSPDATFSGDGKATFAATVRNPQGQTVQGTEEAEGLAVDVDGSVYVSGRTGIGLGQSSGEVLLVKLTPGGAPDPGFGEGGKVVVPELDEGSGLLIQPSDGYVVVGGYAASNTTGFEDFALARFDPFGNPDTWFGPTGTGVTTADFPANGFTTVTSGALQPDGKIVIGGFTIVRSDNLRDIAFVRYNADGTLDDTFGVGGIVQIDLGAAAGSDIGERVSALALDADGRIVFAGIVEDPSTQTSDLLVGRLLPGGAPDPAFAGGAGIVQIGSFAGNPGADEIAGDVLVQPDGRIVVVGAYQPTSTTSEFLALRLEPDGSFDFSFGPDGSGTLHAQFPNGVTDSSASAVALAPDEDGQGFDLVLAGDAQVGGFDHFALLRLNDDGSPDFAFGTAGRTSASMPSASIAGANDVVVDSQGRILAGGTARRGNDDFGLMRWTPAGVLDTTFGNQGKVLTDFDAGGTDQLNSLALLPDGSILAGGTGSSNFALARYTADGALDTSFGTAGRAVTDFAPGFYPSAPATSRDQGVRVFAYPGDRAVMIGSGFLPRTGPDFAAARYTLLGPPNAAPVANPGGPYTMNEGGTAPLVLSGAGSSDADGTIIKYEWDLNYDNLAGFQPDVANVRADVPPQSDEGTGTRRLALRVTDDNFATHTVVFNVTMTNVAPAIAPIADATVQHGTPFAAAGSFTDPGTTDTFTATVNWGDGAQGPLALNPDKTFTLNHDYANPGTYTVVVTVRDNDGGVGTEEVVVNVRGQENSVASRLVYYHRSKFDSGVDNPQTAVPSQKTPLLPGDTAVGTNITNYTRGINGIVVGLSGPGAPDVSADDFQFKVGTGGDPSAWAAAPAPERVQVLPPLNGVSRVVITWPDAAIVNTWLQVTVLANADTKLLRPDVFYYGNLVGNAASPPGRIDQADYSRTRHDFALSGVPITQNSDHDHDGRVGALDIAAVKRNMFQSIQMITVPAVAAAAAPAPTAAAISGSQPAPSVLTALRAARRDAATGRATDLLR